MLAKQPRPKGPRLTIVTNAGGPAVLATDTLITEKGELTEIGPETIEAYNKILPATWSRNNPVDIIGDATRSGTPRRSRLPPRIPTATACW